MTSAEQKDGESEKRAGFATTCWTAVFLAADRQTPDGQTALDELCRQYWYPLYSFIRRKGYPPQNAEDLTQSFFHFLLEKNNFAKADQLRGRFRNFLLTSLTNFLHKQHRYDQAKKRKPEKLWGIDYHQGETRYAQEPADSMTPEKFFDRAWGMTLLQSAMQELERYYQDSGKLELYQQLTPFLVRDADHLTYAEMAQKLQLSEGAIKVAVHRMRERSRRILREKISQTVDQESDIDLEIQQLFNILAK